MSRYLFQPWWQRCGLMCFHTNTHTHTSKDGKMNLCKHTQSAHTQRKYIFMCLCHMTLSAYQSSLQRKAAEEWVAMKSRRDPRIVGNHMKVFGYQGERGVSTNWNVNCTGLHNFRVNEGTTADKISLILSRLALLYWCAFH